MMLMVIFSLKIFSHVYIPENERPDTQNDWPWKHGGTQP